MEIELKYNVVGEQNIEELIKKMESIPSVKCENKGKHIMKAVYYDTKSYDMLSNGYALRIRKELGQWIGTVKTSGKAQNGLHKREEYNCHVTGIKDFKQIDIDVFEALDIYHEMIAITKEKYLYQLFISEIDRDQLIVNYKDSVIEVVYDQGYVVAEEKKTKVNEIEMELIKGKEDELLELGRQLEKMIELEPSDISKFGRGLELVGYNKK